MKTRYRPVVWCLGLGLTSILSAVAQLGAAETAPRRATSEPVVAMRPFTVMAEWIEIQPMLRDGLVDHIRIVHVQASSPAGIAGVQAGMQVVEIQGIAVGGLSGPELQHRLENLPPAKELSLKVRSYGNKEPTVVTVPLDAAGVPAGTKPKPAATPTVATVPLSVAEVNAMLASARRAFGDDMARVRAEARQTGKASTSTYLQAQVSQDLGRALPLHLELLCEAAVKAGGSMDGSFIRSAIVSAISSRTANYAPEHKAIVLRYLPKLPDLITLVERFGWYEGAEAAVGAGWKKLSGEIVDDIPSLRTSQYAVLAARHGVVDALVVLARVTLTKARSEPSKRKSAPTTIARIIAEEESTLKALVPSQSGDAAAVANFIVKNKNRLEFDVAKGVYGVKP
jgi:hypothetical protein